MDKENILHNVVKEIYNTFKDKSDFIPIETLKGDNGNDERLIFEVSSIKGAIKAGLLARFLDMPIECKFTNELKVDGLTNIIDHHVRHTVSDQLSQEIKPSTENIVINKICPKCVQTVAMDDSMVREISKQAFIEFCNSTVEESLEDELFEIFSTHADQSLKTYQKGSGCVDCDNTGLIKE